MSALANMIGRVIAAVICVLLVAMCAVVFAEVLSRYLSLGSLAWSDEAARFLFVWTALLGASLGVREGSHFVINYLADAVPESVRSGLMLFGAIVTSLVYVVLIYQGWHFVELNGSQLSPALDVSMSVPYLVVPVSGALMLFFTWVNVLEQWRHPRRPPLIDQASLPNVVE